MHPFSLSLFHYLSETSEKMLLLLLFSKARNKLDETGVLIRAESIISVYIRSGRDEGRGGGVQLMKCCGRTSLRDACCRLHLRLIVFCVFSAI